MIIGWAEALRRVHCILYAATHIGGGSAAQGRETCRYRARRRLTPLLGGDGVPLDRHILRSLTDMQAAATFMRELGYTAQPQQIDTAELGLDEFSRNLLLQSGRTMRAGYRVLIAELREPPRRWATIGRRLAEHLHDRPLAIIGVPGPGGAWERVFVLRPRMVRTPKGMSYKRAAWSPPRPQNPAQRYPWALTASARSGSTRRSSSVADSVLAVQIPARPSPRTPYGGRPPTGPDAPGWRGAAALR